MNTATTTATASINEAKQSLTKGLRHMMDETDQLLKAAAASGDQKFDEVRDRFLEQVKQMRDQLDDLEETAIVKAKQAARAADRTVHDHPYGAMGIAAAVGLLVGFLVAKR